MTIMVQRTTGGTRVDRLSAPRGLTVSRQDRVLVTRDSRGPVGRQGIQGLAGQVTIIEPPDPGDSFILALEGGML